MAGCHSIQLLFSSPKEEIQGLFAIYISTNNETSQSLMYKLIQNTKSLILAVKNL